MRFVRFTGFSFVPRRQSTESSPWPQLMAQGVVSDLLCQTNARLLPQLTHIVRWVPPLCKEKNTIARQRLSLLQPHTCSSSQRTGLLPRGDQRTFVLPFIHDTSTFIRSRRIAEFHETKREQRTQGRERLAAAIIKVTISHLHYCEA